MDYLKNLEHARKEMYKSLERAKQNLQKIREHLSLVEKENEELRKFVDEIKRQ